MTVFQHFNRQLHCEQVSLAALAAEVGTPAYVYSRAELLDRAGNYQAATNADDLVCYAVKANGNPTLLRLLAQEGLGADVTSGGELFLALHAGIDPQKIIYSGVGKRQDELLMALKAGIRALHVESALELDALAKVARELQLVAPVGVRINPDICVDTHDYDSTGELTHKFGVPRETALTLLKKAQQDPWLNPVGIAAHIGSQITDLVPYQQLAATLVDFAQKATRSGIHLSYVDVGGGLGIDYDQDDPPAIGDWVAEIAQPVRDAGFDLVIEPGRSIIGPAGGLLTRVLYTKEQGGKSFVIVDAGLNDLIRPAMYGANHPIIAVGKNGADKRVDIVGPVCETGDFLAHNRLLPALAAGDLLLLGQAGAYGFAMSSNYNGRLRPAEVLVDGGDYAVIRQRQGFEALLDGVDQLAEVSIQ